MTLALPPNFPADASADLRAHWRRAQANYCGKKSPHRFGVSLLPLARGEVEAVHDAIFSEIGRRGHLNYMVRTDRYKWSLQNGCEYLHDMRVDPYEINNLIESPAHQNVVEMHKKRLLTCLMQTQVNVSADYKPLFTRIGIRANREPGMADRLLEMFRSVHSNI